MSAQRVDVSAGVITSPVMQGAMSPLGGCQTLVVRAPALDEPPIASPRSGQQASVHDPPAEVLSAHSRSSSAGFGSGMLSATAALSGSGHLHVQAQSITSSGVVSPTGSQNIDHASTATCLSPTGSAEWVGQGNKTNKFPSGPGHSATNPTAVDHTRNIMARHPNHDPHSLSPQAGVFTSGGVPLKTDSFRQLHLDGNQQTHGLRGDNNPQNEATGGLSRHHAKSAGDVVHVHMMCSGDQPPRPGEAQHGCDEAEDEGEMASSANRVLQRRRGSILQIIKAASSAASLDVQRRQHQQGHMSSESLSRGTTGSSSAVLHDEAKPAGHPLDPASPLVMARFTSALSSDFSEASPTQPQRPSASSDNGQVGAATSTTILGETLHQNPAVASQVTVLNLSDSGLGFSGHSLPTRTETFNSPHNSTSAGDVAGGQLEDSVITFDQMATSEAIFSTEAMRLRRPRSSFVLGPHASVASDDGALDCVARVMPTCIVIEFVDPEATTDACKATTPAASSAQRLQRERVFSIDSNEGIAPAPSTPHDRTGSAPCRDYVVHRIAVPYQDLRVFETEHLRSYDPRVICGTCVTVYIASQPSCSTSGSFNSQQQLQQQQSPQPNHPQHGATFPTEQPEIEAILTLDVAEESVGELQDFVDHACRHHSRFRHARKISDLQQSQGGDSTGAVAAIRKALLAASLSTGSNPANTDDEVSLSLTILKRLRGFPIPPGIVMRSKSMRLFFQHE